MHVGDSWDGLRDGGVRGGLASTHHLLGHVGRDRRVPAVGIGADSDAELLVHRSATDQDDVVVAHTALDHLVDDDLHVGHRRGEQGRHAQDVGLVLLEGVEIGTRVVVDADVDHLESCALEHHPDEVLADVVDVALDGADHDLADRLGPGLGQERSQDRHPRFHRVRGEEYLRDEQDAVAEVHADNAHPLDERLVEGPLRRPTTVEQDPGALVDLVGHAVVQVVVHLLDQLVIGQGCEVEVVISHGLFLSGWTVASGSAMDRERAVEVERAVAREEREVELGAGVGALHTDRLGLVVVAVLDRDDELGHGVCSERRVLELVARRADRDVEPVEVRAVVDRDPVVSDVVDADDPERVVGDPQGRDPPGQPERLAFPTGLRDRALVALGRVEPLLLVAARLEGADRDHAARLGAEVDAGVVVTHHAVEHAPVGADR